MQTEERERESIVQPRDLVRRLKIARNAVVADVGAGGGFLTILLADAAPHGRIIATELRADLVGMIRRRARSASCRHVEARVVSRDDPGLGATSVDLIVLCQVDHHVLDRESHLRSLVPALRPDGRMVLANFAQFYHLDTGAARAASLQLIDEWWPSPSFFVAVVAPESATPR